MGNRKIMNIPSVVVTAAAANEKESKIRLSIVLKITKRFKGYLRQTY